MASSTSPVTDSPASGKASLLRNETLVFHATNVAIANRLLSLRIYQVTPQTSSSSMSSADSCSPRAYTGFRVAATDEMENDYALFVSRTKTEHIYAQYAQSSLTDLPTDTDAPPSVALLDTRGVAACLATHLDITGNLHRGLGRLICKDPEPVVHRKPRVVPHDKGRSRQLPFKKYNDKRASRARRSTVRAMEAIAAASALTGSRPRHSERAGETDRLHGSEHSSGITSSVEFVEESKQDIQRAGGSDLVAALHEDGITMCSGTTPTNVGVEPLETATQGYGLRKTSEASILHRMAVASERTVWKSELEGFADEASEYMELMEKGNLNGDDVLDTSANMTVGSLHGTTSSGCGDQAIDQALFAANMNVSSPEPHSVPKRIVPERKTKHKDLQKRRDRERNQRMHVTDAGSNLDQDASQLAGTALVDSWTSDASNREHHGVSTRPHSTGSPSRRVSAVGVRKQVPVPEAQTLTEGLQRATQINPRMMEPEHFLRRKTVLSSEKRVFKSNPIGLGELMGVEITKDRPEHLLHREAVAASTAADLPAIAQRKLLMHQNSRRSSITRDKDGNLRRNSQRRLEIEPMASPSATLLRGPRNDVDIKHEHRPSSSPAVGSGPLSASVSAPGLSLSPRLSPRHGANQLDTKQLETTNVPPQPMESYSSHEPRATLCAQDRTSVIGTPISQITDTVDVGPRDEMNGDTTRISSSTALRAPEGPLFAPDKDPPSVTGEASVLINPSDPSISDAKALIQMSPTMDITSMNDADLSAIKGQHTADKACEELSSVGLGVSVLGEESGDKQRTPRLDFSSVHEGFSVSPSVPSSARRGPVDIVINESERFLDPEENAAPVEEALTVAAPIVDDIPATTMAVNSRAGSFRLEGWGPGEREICLPEKEDLGDLSSTLSTRDQVNPPELGIRCDEYIHSNSHIDAPDRQDIQQSRDQRFDQAAIINDDGIADTSDVLAGDLTEKVASEADGEPSFNSDLAHTQAPILSGLGRLTSDTPRIGDGSESASPQNMPRTHEHDSLPEVVNSSSTARLEIAQEFKTNDRNEDKLALQHGHDRANKVYAETISTEESGGSNLDCMGRDHKWMALEVAAMATAVVGAVTKEATVSIGRALQNNEVEEKPPNDFRVRSPPSPALPRRSPATERTNSTTTIGAPTISVIENNNELEHGDLYATQVGSPEIVLENVQVFQSIQHNDHFPETAQVPTETRDDETTPFFDSVAHVRAVDEDTNSPREIHLSHAKDAPLANIPIEVAMTPSPETAVELNASPPQFKSRRSSVTEMQTIAIASAAAAAAVRAAQQSPRLLLPTMDTGTSVANGAVVHPLLSTNCSQDSLTRSEQPSETTPAELQAVASNRSRRRSLAILPSTNIGGRFALPRRSTSKRLLSFPTSNSNTRLLASPLLLSEPKEKGNDPTAPISSLTRQPSGVSTVATSSPTPNALVATVSKDSRQSDGDATMSPQYHAKWNTWNTGRQIIEKVGCLQLEELVLESPHQERPVAKLGIRYARWPSTSLAAVLLLEHASLLHNDTSTAGRTAITRTHEYWNALGNAHFDLFLRNRKFLPVARFHLVRALQALTHALAYLESMADPLLLLRYAICVYWKRGDGNVILAHDIVTKLFTQFASFCDKNRANLKFLLFQILFRLARHQDALACLNTIIREHNINSIPSSSSSISAAAGSYDAGDYLLMVVHCQQACGDYLQASSTFSTMLRARGILVEANLRDSDYLLLWGTLADKCFQLEDYVLALEFYSTAMAFAKDSSMLARVLYKRGLCFQAQGDQEQCHAEFKRARNVNRRVSPTVTLAQLQANYEDQFALLLKTPIPQVIEDIRLKLYDRAVTALQRIFRRRKRSEAENASDCDGTASVSFNLNRRKSSTSSSCFGSSRGTRNPRSGVHSNIERIRKTLEHAKPIEDGSDEDMQSGRGDDTKPTSDDPLTSEKNAAMNAHAEFLARRAAAIDRVLDLQENQHYQASPGVRRTVGKTTATPQSGLLSPEKNRPELRRKRSMEAYTRLGYVPTSMPCVAYWEQLVATAMDLYETQSVLMLAIARVRASLVKVNDTMACFALAESMGEAEVAIEKLSDATYLRELSYLASVVEVAPIIQRHFDSAKAAEPPAIRFPPLSPLTHMTKNPSSPHSIASSSGAVQSLTSTGISPSKAFCETSKRVTLPPCTSPQSQPGSTGDGNGTSRGEQWRQHDERTASGCIEFVRLAGMIDAHMERHEQNQNHIPGQNNSIGSKGGIKQLSPAKMSAMRTGKGKQDGVVVLTHFREVNRSVLHARDAFQ